MVLCWSSVTGQQAASWNQHVKHDITSLRRLQAGGDALLSLHSAPPSVTMCETPDQSNSDVSSVNTSATSRQSEVTADTDHTLLPVFKAHRHTHHVQTGFPPKSVDHILCQVLMSHKYIRGGSHNKNFPIVGHRTTTHKMKYNAETLLSLLSNALFFIYILVSCKTKFWAQSFSSCLQ